MLLATDRLILRELDLAITLTGSDAMIGRCDSLIYAILDREWV